MAGTQCDWSRKFAVKLCHIQGTFDLGAARMQKGAHVHALEIVSVSGSIEVGDYVAWVSDRDHLRLFADHQDMPLEYLAIGKLTSAYVTRTGEQRVQARYLECGIDVPRAKSDEILVSCCSGDFPMEAIVGRIEVTAKNGANPYGNAMSSGEHTTVFHFVF